MDTPATNPSGLPTVPRPANPAQSGGNVQPGASKIQFPQQGFGGRAAPPSGPGAVPASSPADAGLRSMTQLQPEHVPMAAEAEGPSAFARKTITPFGTEKRHDDKWKRSPNATGQGAIHVKTFHCKLTEDALNYMDQLINEWLDTHPQYEVKFVTSTIGTFTGKLKEPALICQVWV